MRRPRLLLVALLVVTACGGGDDEAAPRPTRGATTTVAPPVLAPTTTAPPPTTTTLPLPPLPALPAGDVRAITTGTGVIVPVEAVVAGGFQVRTPCGGVGTLNGAPVAATMVVLDPGHGGNESGAIGPNGLREKDINLNVARAAEAALERVGIPTVLTRTGDYRVTLDVRALIATRLRPLAFVSVHHNSAPDGPLPKPGSETYFQVASPESKRLSGLLYEEIVHTLSGYGGIPWVGDTDAGAKYRLNSRGGDYYGILRRSAGVPSSLTELAFLSNAPEADLLARPEVQQAEGEALARGLVRYLTTPDPGSGFTEPYPREEPAGPGGGSQGCVDPPF